MQSNSKNHSSPSTRVNPTQLSIRLSKSSTRMRRNSMFKIMINGPKRHSSAIAPCVSLKLFLSIQSS